MKILKAKKLLLLIPVVLSALFIVGFLFFTSTDFEEKPPSLDEGGASLQGNIGNSADSVYLEINAYSDIDAFTSFDRHPAGVNYFYSDVDKLYFDDIKDSIYSETDNKCLILTYVNEWADEGFYVYPKGPYANTYHVEDIGDFGVLKWQGYNIICSKPFYTAGLIDSNMPPSDNSFDKSLNSFNEGWHMIGFPNSNDFLDFYNSCANRVGSAWHKDGDFMKLDLLSLENFSFKEHLFWIKVIGEKDTCIISDLFSEGDLRNDDSELYINNEWEECERPEQSIAGDRFFCDYEKAKWIECKNDGDLVDGDFYICEDGIWKDCSYKSALNNTYICDGNEFEGAWEKCDEAGILNLDSTYLCDGTKWDYCRSMGSRNLNNKFLCDSIKGEAGFTWMECLDGVEEHFSFNNQFICAEGAWHICHNYEDNTYSCENGENYKY